MSTQNLYDEWERKQREKWFEQGFAQGFAQGFEQGFERGREQEAKRVLALLYQARFGGMPLPVADAIEATHDIATLERWLVLVGTQSQEEVAAAVQADSPPQTS